MRLLFFVLSLIILLITSCTKSPKYLPLQQAQKIEVGAGPEDFVLDTFTIPTKARLLVSCSERRTPYKNHEIYGYNLKDKLVKILPRLNEPKDLYFRPHGIDIQYDSSQKSSFLYVISHNDALKQHSVIIYKIQEHNLVFQKELQSPLLVSPNDLGVGTKIGTFYVVNDSKKRTNLWEKLWAKRTSNILYFDGNLFKEVASKIAYGNSAFVHQNQLYVSATQRKELLNYTILNTGELTTPKNILKVNGLDNLMYDAHSNTLLVTAHTKPIAFLKHLKNKTKKSPSKIYGIDLTTQKAHLLLEEDGSSMSAISTALIYKDQLYLGQVFENFLVQIPLNKLKIIP